MYCGRDQGIPRDQRIVDPISPEGALLLGPMVIPGVIDAMQTWVELQRHSDSSLVGKSGSSADMSEASPAFPAASLAAARQA